MGPEGRSQLGKTSPVFDHLEDDAINSNVFSPVLGENFFVVVFSSRGLISGLSCMTQLAGSIHIIDQFGRKK